MKNTKIYETERAFLKRKFPTLKCTWETRELIEQLVTPLLECLEAEHIHQKLLEGLRAKAADRLATLLQSIEVDKRRALFRIVISVRDLRLCFGEELTDQSDTGGTGGTKNRLNPSNRFGRF